KKVSAVSLFKHSLVIESWKGKRPSRSVVTLDVDVGIDCLRVLKSGEGGGNPLQRGRRKQSSGRRENDKITVRPVIIQKHSCELVVQASRLGRSPERCCDPVVVGLLA